MYEVLLFDKYDFMQVLYLVGFTPKLISSITVYPLPVPEFRLLGYVAIISQHAISYGTQHMHRLIHFLPDMYRGILVAEVEGKDIGFVPIALSTTVSTTGFSHLGTLKKKLLDSSHYGKSLLISQKYILLMQYSVYFCFYRTDKQK